MTESERSVRRNPVPSLLRSLMSEHLDPGYAAAADRRAREHARADRIPQWLWVVVGAVAVGIVLGAALGQVASAAPDNERLRAETLSAVRDAEARTGALDDTRTELSGDVDEARTEALRENTEGSTLLDTLGGLERAAGLDAVHGPGISVTVTDPAARSDLTDRARRTQRTTTSAVLDRDLQSVVNSLWVSGAEAVAISGVRVGPSVTIRQAGGAMLVDNRPVSSPYTVSAIGPPELLGTRFTVSDAYLRMSTVAQLYGVGFTITDVSDLDLPPAVLRETGSGQEMSGR